MALFHKYWDAVNLGDAAAAAAFLAEDRLLEDYIHGPPDVFHGREAIQGLLQNRAVNVNLHVTPISVDGCDSTLTGRAERSIPESYRTAGFERLVESFTVKVEDDEISSIRVLPDLTDPQTARWSDLLKSHGLEEPGTVVPRGDIEADPGQDPR